MYLEDEMNAHVDGHLEHLRDAAHESVFARLAVVLRMGPPVAVGVVARGPKTGLGHAQASGQPGHIGGGVDAALIMGLHAYEDAEGLFGDARVPAHDQGSVDGAAAQ